MSITKEMLAGEIQGLQKQLQDQSNAYNAATAAVKQAESLIAQIRGAIEGYSHLIRKIEADEVAAATADKPAATDAPKEPDAQAADKTAE